LYVNWYTSFLLSLLDPVIINEGQGISVTHTRILRRVPRYLPEFETAGGVTRRSVGGSRRMDENYIKVHGDWVNLYRRLLKRARLWISFSVGTRDVSASVHKDRVWAADAASHPAM
jgi:transposase-like protein